ncbi:TetR/AcrR family transcriptional regulator [Rhizobium sp. GN54]|uniref:TetR/AcrR family transcriptional regulator n=1 Tax=Rhizobium sp. GN54 TaxID=2898150 RepID=UPI001E4A8C68|nr:TetR/AcrR family transcriptional regulator [Rhizobium sp. GN54]MCD2185412.1 TetR/AcrR family transcriptional regulator [Rhizobium sp. GN54]
MTHVKDKRPYHHGDLRQAVIETAMTMLREGSGSGFKLREVARRAGVSHAAPYKHFADKAALLAEIALIGFDSLRERIIAAQERFSNDIPSALLATSKAYIAFGQENPDLYRLMFGAKIGAAEDVHLDQRALGVFEIVIDLLERGQAAGSIRTRPARGQAAACWAQLHGITMLMLDGLLIPEKVGDDAIEAALETLQEGLSA